MGCEFFVDGGAELARVDNSQSGNLFLLLPLFISGETGNSATTFLRVGCRLSRLYGDGWPREDCQKPVAGQP